MPTIHKISPHYDSRKLEGKTLQHDLDEFADVYADRVNGWLLDWAHHLNGPEHAGFAAIQLALTFFEGFGVVYYGEDSKREPAAMFGRGFRLVFPELNGIPAEQSEPIVRSFYEQVRCGLLHLATPRSKVILQDNGRALTFHCTRGGGVSHIVVDRHEFVRQIRRRFNDYISELRTPSAAERRARFADGWKILHSL